MKNKKYWLQWLKVLLFMVLSVIFMRLDQSFWAAISNYSRRNLLVWLLPSYNIVSQLLLGGGLGYPLWRGLFAKNKPLKISYYYVCLSISLLLVFFISVWTTSLTTGILALMSRNDLGMIITLLGYSISGILYKNEGNILQALPKNRFVIPLIITVCLFILILYSDNLLHTLGSYLFGRYLSPWPNFICNALWLIVFGFLLYMPNQLDFFTNKNKLCFSWPNIALMLFMGAVMLYIILFTDWLMLFGRSGFFLAWLLGGYFLCGILYRSKDIAAIKDKK